MRNTKFGRKELKKQIQCSCLAMARLIRRRIHSHGKNSSGKSYSIYKCESCFKETPAFKTGTNNG